MNTKLIDVLSSNEEMVIASRFGKGPHPSFDTIAGNEDIPRENIRQMEHRALGKLARLSPQDLTELLTTASFKSVDRAALVQCVTQVRPNLRRRNV